MREFTKILKEATRCLPRQYFSVDVSGGDHVYRERVYCYELYHQMRSMWPAKSEYCLMGELDKVAHPILKELGADYAKPDLLVHKPGYMDKNGVIIEVKTCGAKKAGIQKDLKTLTFFQTEKIGYKRSIYLLFGYEVEKTVDLVQTVAKSMGDLARIELWLHAKSGQVATHTFSLG